MKDGAASGEPAADGPVAEGPEAAVRLTAWVGGHVQGVGFRWWTRCRALELALVGSASNLVDGRVEVVAQGRRAQAERLLALLDPGAPAAPETRRRRPGRVDGVTHRWSDPVPGISGFVER